MIKFDLRIGSCLKVLQELPDNYFHTCVTSPPYWGLRDYGTGKWVGGDVNCPHKRTTKIGKTVKTITGHQGMHDQGSVVGDAIYKSVCPKCGAVRSDEQLGLEETPELYINKLVSVFAKVHRVLRNDGTIWVNLGDTYGKEKGLIGIPWKFAFAMQEFGWYLRQDIIWHKPNPMPESVKDRCTKSHEYIFLLSKKPHYYFDSEAISEEANYKGVDRGGSTNRYEQNNFGADNRQYDKRNKRSVWSVCPSAYKEAHFAVFPEELITPCILSGSPEYGNVLDPFGGSGTVGLACKRHKRNVTLIELNPKYEKFIRSRYKEPVQDLLV
jgi:site-specific DNA-methyltransferase (adenine-specific)|tara:strand:- start:15735 stop:16709 length:975 start_codon:yes stop_codon:yes gene_type:complete